MKTIAGIFFLITSITLFAQNNNEYIKKMGEYTDTSSYYYPYSTPFSFVFRTAGKTNIRIEFWSLVKKDSTEERASLLDQYKLPNLESGKYLFLWDRENKIKFKGSVLFLLFYDDIMQNYARFIQN